MMMQPPYESLPPASKAIADYRHGGDQDCNPYNKATHPAEWEAYAWKMHELWHNDFKAERQLDKVRNEENGNGKRNKSAKAARGIPGGSNEGDSGGTNSTPRPF